MMPKSGKKGRIMPKTTKQLKSGPNITKATPLTLSSNNSNPKNSQYGGRLIINSHDGRNHFFTLITPDLIKRLKDMCLTLGYRSIQTNPTASRHYWCPSVRQRLPIPGEVVKEEINATGPRVPQGFLELATKMFQRLALRQAWPQRFGEILDITTTRQLRNTRAQHHHEHGHKQLGSWPYDEVGLLTCFLEPWRTTRHPHMSCELQSTAIINKMSWKYVYFKWYFCRWVHSTEQTPFTGGASSWHSSVSKVSQLQQCRKIVLHKDTKHWHHQGLNPSIDSHERIRLTSKPTPLQRNVINTKVWHKRYQSHDVDESVIPKIT